MDMDRMEEMARDPRFISGIYNYCDAWCDRCAFTWRCMNYAMAQEEEAARDSRSRDAENEAFWDKLNETFESTMEMVDELAAETDFDIDEEELEESIRRDEAVREAAHSQPYSRVAMKYMDVADEWFTSKQSLLDDVGGDPELGVRAKNLDTGTAAIRDCLEVIRWYQRLIYVKLCRAATGTLRAGIDDHEYLQECMQEDADGSAKVAIIGIERSIAAWATLLRRFPDHEDAIFCLALLKRLLRQVDAAFPNARAFRRPGFDTEGDRRE